MPANQVSFYKGVDASAYLQDVSTYSGGIFFDTTNKEIYLNGQKYTEKKFLDINSASVVSTSGSPYLILDITSSLGNTNIPVKLPHLIEDPSLGGIDVSLDPSTNTYKVGLEEIDVSTSSQSNVTVDFSNTSSFTVVGDVVVDSHGRITGAHPVTISFGEPVSYWNEID